MKIINSIIKRLFDIFTSLIGIILLSPVLIIISICIKVDSKGPVIFKQTRVGKNGRFFSIYKFRTMINNSESLGRQITIGKDSRITKIGSFIRKYKIDEFPQLFNVLFGTMSLVGPRPEVPQYVKLYNDDQRRVLEVKPGITDLASIRYCDENEVLAEVDNPDEYYVNVIMPHKLKLNIEYIDKSNLLFDIKLILKTIVKCI